MYGSSLSQGSGTVTVDALPGNASTLAAFTYTLTASASGLPTVETTFGPSDVTTFQSTVSGTAEAPILDSFDLSGAAVNNAFFNLTFLAQFSTSGQPLPLDSYYSASAGFPEVGSEGTAVYTAVTTGSTAVTPEPSSFDVLVDRVHGESGVLRRR